MKIKKQLNLWVFYTCCLLSGPLFGQHNQFERPVNISESNEPLPASAQMAVQSDMPFRFPVLDSAEIYAITNPADGLIVLGRHDGCLYVHQSGKWDIDCFDHFFSAVDPMPNPKRVWNQKNNFPGVARRNAFATELNGNIYYGCGRSDSFFLRSDCWRYNIESETWTSIAPLPGSTREGASAFVSDGNLYVGGGSAFSGALDDFWKYDEQLDQWVAVSSLPGARKGAFSFTIDDEGYVGGGTATGTGLSGDIWKYDANQDLWVARASVPSSARSSRMANFVIDGSAYFVCEHAELFWEYNAANDTWSTKADFVPNHDVRIGFSIGQKGFIGLGRESASDPLIDLYEYDPVQDSWKPIDDIRLIGPDNTPYLYPAAVSLPDRAYLIGGASSTKFGLKTVLEFMQSATQVVKTNADLESEYLSIDEDMQSLHEILFSAGYSSNHTLAPGTAVIPFDTKPVDPTNAFTTGANSRFTAPRSGYYYFSTNVSFDAGDGVDDTIGYSFRKNGVTTHLYMYIDPRYFTRSGREFSSSLSGIIYCDKDDIVQLFTSGVASSGVRATRRTFSGFFISQ